MTCGLVRLICEDSSPSSSWEPPSNQQGRPLVIDVWPWEVAGELAKLRAEGWQFVTQWPL